MLTCLFGRITISTMRGYAEGEGNSTCGWRRAGPWRSALREPQGERINSDHAEHVETRHNPRASEVPPHPPPLPPGERDKLGRSALLQSGGDEAERAFGALGHRPVLPAQPDERLQILQRVEVAA